MCSDYLIVVSICISLMFNDDHLFMWLFVFLCILLDAMSLNVLCLFFLWIPCFFISLLDVWLFFYYWSGYRDYVSDIFSQSIVCLFILLKGSLLSKSLKFWWSQFCKFFLLWRILVVSNLRTSLALILENVLLYVFLKVL